MEDDLPASDYPYVVYDFFFCQFFLCAGKRPTCLYFCSSSRGPLSVLKVVLHLSVADQVPAVALVVRLDIIVLSACPGTAVVGGLPT